MKLSQLTEGRDAPLYHGTNLINFVSIMNDGYIGGGDNTDAMYDPLGATLTIRASRDYELAKTTFGIRGGVFELDQRKIAQRYRIIPFQDEDAGATRDTGASEYEEVIVADKLPIDRYMTRFFVSKSDVLWATKSVLGKNSLREFWYMRNLSDEYIEAVGDKILSDNRWVDIS